MGCTRWICSYGEVGSLYSAVDLVQAMKKATLGAVEQAGPVGVVFGTVVSTTPLAVQVDQKLTIGAAQLVCSALTREFSVSMTVEHQTEENDGGLPPHTHPYTGTKLFAVHLGLKKGERVVMLREQGGQRYFILDKVVDQ